MFVNFTRQEQIEENIRFELKTAEENYAESNKRNMNQLVDKEVFQIFNFFLILSFLSFKIYFNILEY